jgi:hypothetical protein
MAANVNVLRQSLSETIGHTLFKLIDYFTYYNILRFPNLWNSSVLNMIAKTWMKDGCHQNVKKLQDLFRIPLYISQWNFTIAITTTLRFPTLWTSSIADMATKTLIKYGCWYHVLRQSAIQKPLEIFFWKIKE